MKKIICVLLVLAMMLSLTACGANSSYKSVIKNLFSSMEKADAKKMLKIYPDEVLEGLEEEYDDMDELIEEMEDMLDDLLDEAEDEFGKNIKFTFEIEDENELDEDKIEDLMDDYDNYMDVDLEIKKAYELELEVTVEGKKDDDSTDMTFVVIKVGGKWYIDVTSMSLF